MKTLLLNGLIYLFVSFLFTSSYFIYHDVTSIISRPIFTESFPDGEDSRLEDFSKLSLFGSSQEKIDDNN